MTTIGEGHLPECRLIAQVKPGPTLAGAGREGTTSSLAPCDGHQYCPPLLRELPDRAARSSPTVRSAPRNGVTTGSACAEDGGDGAQSDAFVCLVVAAAAVEFVHPLVTAVVQCDRPPLVVEDGTSGAAGLGR